jgi:hypothetical protein
MDKLVTAWKQGNFTPPSISYAVNAKNGDTYLVLEDDSTIYRLINKFGQIYVIAAFRCDVVSLPTFMNGTSFYSIHDPVLHIVMCSKIDSSRDRFAIDNLITRFL